MNKKFFFDSWKLEEDFSALCDICTKGTCHRHVFDKTNFLANYSCLICCEEIRAEELLIFPCGHSQICPKCINNLILEKGNTKKPNLRVTCPVCRKEENHYFALKVLKGDMNSSDFFFFSSNQASNKERGIRCFFEGKLELKE